MKISEEINRGGDLDQEYEKWSKNIEQQYEKQLKSVTRKNEWKLNRLLLKQIKKLKRMKRENKLTEEEEEMINQRIELLREHCENEIRIRNASKIQPYGIEYNENRKKRYDTVLEI